MNHGLYKKFTEALEQHMEGVAILSTVEMVEMRVQVEQAQHAEDRKRENIQRELRASEDLLRRLEELEDKLLDQLLEERKEAYEATVIESALWESFGAELVGLIKTRNHAA